MKKSYLSKQVIAAIVIATVVAVMIPLYFIVLKPMFDNTEDEPGEQTEDLYEPLLESETRMSGAQSAIGKTTGGNVYIYDGKFKTNGQKIDLHTKNGDWSFTQFSNGNYMITDYESIVVNYWIAQMISETARRPIASHIAPSTEQLLKIQHEKADKMTAEELEKAGGWNALIVNEEDIKDIVINYDQYGLGDLDAADSVFFTDTDGRTVTLYLGGYTPDGTQRYARFDSSRAVYKLNENSTRYLDYTMYDMMPTTLIDVPESVATGDYMPDEFRIYRNGEAYVQIQRFSDEEVLAADKLKKSQVIETAGDLQTSYDTSGEYAAMLYQYFLSGVLGSKVVDAVKSTTETVGEGLEYFIHGEPTDEQFQEFNIDPENPYRVLFTTKYIDEENRLDNLLVFSTPFVEDGQTCFYVYNVYQGTILKVYESSIPFIEYERDFFINKFIWNLSINKVDTITLDATSFPSSAAADGMRFDKETVKVEYKMNGSVRATTSTGLEIIENVTLTNGTRIPDAPQDSNVENYRHFYYFLSKATMYVGYLEEHREEIKVVQERGDAPQLTLTCKMYGTDDTHVMKFYIFDEAKLWMFYTLDDKGPYLVKTNDIKKLVLGFQAVFDGKAVTDILGPIG